MKLYQHHLERPAMPTVTLRLPDVKEKVMSDPRNVHIAIEKYFNDGEQLRNLSKIQSYIP